MNNIEQCTSSMPQIKIQAKPSATMLDTRDHADMVFTPGGTFRMGSDKHYAEEAPVHRVTVGAFWIDRTPVTNR